MEHLAAGGSTRHTLRATAGVIYRSAVYMNLDENSSVEHAEVEEAATGSDPINAPASSLLLETVT